MKLKIIGLTCIGLITLFHPTMQLAGQQAESANSKNQIHELIFKLEKSQPKPNPNLPPIKPNAEYKQLPLIVVIDPGHGTKNARGGAPGEAEINYIIAKQLSDYLTKQNITNILTRKSNGTNLGAKNPHDDNRQRAKIANHWQAKLFLRLHCDSSNGSTCVYYPRLHPNKKIAILSAKYATTIAQSLNKISLPCGKCKLKGDEATPIGKQNGGVLVGSQYSQVPTVLIEITPLNSLGKAWITKPQNQLSLVTAIGKSIMNILQNPR